MSAIVFDFDLDLEDLFFYLDSDFFGLEWSRGGSLTKWSSVFMDLEWVVSMFLPFLTLTDILQGMFSLSLFLAPLLTY